MPSDGGGMRGNMKWNKYTIRTIDQAEDIISATLAELGIEGVFASTSFSEGEETDVCGYSSGCSGE